MDDEATGRGRGRRRQRRRGGGRIGGGGQQRGTTRAGATTMKMMSLLPLESAAAADIVLFRYGNTIHVWGGKRPWVTKVDTPRAHVSLSPPGGVNPLVLLGSSSLVLVLVHRPCPIGDGTERRCRRGRNEGYRDPTMTTTAVGGGTRWGDIDDQPPTGVGEQGREEREEYSREQNRNKNLQIKV